MIKISIHKQMAWVIILTTIFMWVIACEQADSANDEKNPPNIVLIFIDDLGYADIGSFGAEDYKTPNIDGLATEGIRFTSFYASQAVCSASRASLLTGCYAERVGILGALGPKANIGLNQAETLIPEMLKAQGYATGIFGKWHLGHHREFLPLQHGFDEYLGLPYSNDMWPVWFDGVPVAGTNNRKAGYPPLGLIAGNEVIDTIATLADQARLTTLYTERAVQFIEKHKNEPFFLYMPHSMVHVPIAVSARFAGKSGKGLFADVMMELDWSVGEILATLKKNGLDDNTLVIFTSDNGPWLNFGNHAGSAQPLREGKGSMWEGGPRVPTVMRWPGKITAGSETDKLAATIDILPTLAEITGTPLPTNKIDGVSILSLMEGKKDANPRDQFYYYYGGELIAVRKHNWKLVFPHRYRSYQGVEPGNDGFPGPYARGVVRAIELYNLQDDIGETTNVAAQNPQVVAELRLIGDAARDELGDKILNIKGWGVRQPGRREQPIEKVQHLAINKNIAINGAYAAQYSGQGNKTLIDGVLGSLDFKDGKWLGFQGNDFTTVIDLTEATTVGEIELRFLVAQDSWIFSPEKIEVLISTDGNNYELVNTINEAAATVDTKQYIKKINTKMTPKNIRYIKIIAKNIGVCPAWHDGAGGKSWLFVDEIMIR